MEQSTWRAPSLSIFKSMLDKVNFTTSVKLSVIVTFVHNLDFCIAIDFPLVLLISVYSFILFILFYLYIFFLLSFYYIRTGLVIWHSLTTYELTYLNKQIHLSKSLLKERFSVKDRGSNETLGRIEADF